MSTKSNLHNIHSFWHALNAQNHHPVYFHCQWPYKVWYDDFALPKAEAIPAHLANNVFCTTQTLSKKQQQDWQIAFSLTMMDLTLSQALITTQSKDSPNIVKLTEPHDLNAWTNACSDAFNYLIDANVIAHLSQHRDASIYAYMVDDKIAATAITFQTGDVLGVHQVGTVPAYRKQGLAEKLMHFIINQAIQDALTSISLQASSAGIHLYQKLGFKEIGQLNALTPL